MNEVKVTDRLRLEELRKEIARGIEQAERGEVAPLDTEGIKAKARLQLTQKEKGTDGPDRPNRSS